MLKLMTREEAIAEAKRRHARSGCQLDRRFAGRRVDGGPHREARRPPNSATSAGGEPSGAFEVEQSQLRHLGMAATRWPWLTNRLSAKARQPFALG